MSENAFSQAPQGINYQGVARDLQGQPLVSKEIAIRISILKGSANGDLEYDEIHEVKTNSFGLFTLVIGEGNPGTSSFNFIGWTQGKKWLQIELDENGGRNFKLMGSQQLMSVPYALYAERAGNGYQAGQGISINNNMISNLGDGDTDPSNELINSVTLGADNRLRITDAGGTKEADLSGLVGAAQNLTSVLAQGNNAGNTAIINLGAPVGASDAATKAYVDAHTDGDGSPTNEIQNLSQVIAQSGDAGGAKIFNLGAPTANADAATKLYVDNLNAADGDKSATNEIQTLSKTASSISLSLGGGAVTLNDDSPTNELQNISTQTVDANTRSLSLTSGNTINVDVRDADASAVNEAQILSKVGSTITLSDILGTGGGAVVLNDDSNTNEAQSINKIGNTVTLTAVGATGGGSFTVDDADADPANELQNLNQVLTRGNSAGGITISNLPTPSAAQDATTKAYVDAADAALSARISTTYSFKAAFDYQNLSGAVVNNQPMPFTDDFDDFNIIGTNTFTATESGIYMFFVEGFYNTATAGGSLSLLYNSIKYPITIVLPFGATQPRFSGTFTFKLTAGQTVSLVGDNIPLLAQFNGKFFGYKL
ncbi:MAG TPA: hypothetical protein DIW27_00790 [Cytophagales bacterium]|nr:hypothetical protein [Cytophagales bacterium]